MRLLSTQFSARRMLASALLLPLFSLTVRAQVLDGFNPRAGDTVFGLAVTPEQHVMASGVFQSMGGVPRSTLARVSREGVLDEGFMANTDGFNTLAVLVQPDGKMVIAGLFTAANGEPRSNIARLNADGSLDTAFNASAPQAVHALALQADGRILAAGYPSGPGNSPILRFNANGSADGTFSAKTSSVVDSMVLQPDGKILIAGNFGQVNGQSRSGIARLNPNGTTDTTFTASANEHVQVLQLQPDGRILLGGYFTQVNGTPRQQLARVNANGTLDTGFRPSLSWNGGFGSIYCMQLQTDGKVHVSGDFDMIAGVSRRNVARLNADGTLDTAFQPGAEAAVYSLALQGNGALVIGGGFFEAGGQQRQCLARFNGTGGVVDQLSLTGSTLTWQRGGSAPEVWRTTFEYSTDGTVWNMIGSGTRVNGGWQRTGVSIPANASVRARGAVTSGYGNASSSFVQSGIGPVRLIGQPFPLRRNAGASAVFAATAEGTGPFTWQWQKGPEILTDGPGISGAQTSTLTFSEVYGKDDSGYVVRVTGPSGSVLSDPARLIVADPFITQQPEPVWARPGDPVSLHVSVAGTAPLTIQWRRNGIPVEGQHSTTLTIPHAGLEHAGEYEATLSNAYGAVQTTPVNLSISGALADAFTLSGTGFASVRIFALAMQTDGALIIGGEFPVPGTQTGMNLARMQPNGTVDTSFAPAVSGTVRALAVQADGKILAGGPFFMINETLRNGLARLNPDGTVDASFDLALDGAVESIIQMPDGGMYIGGSFEHAGGLPRKFIARVLPNGTVDPAFDAGAFEGLPGGEPGSFPFLSAIAVQTDGKVLIGGQFSSVGGSARENIARLNPNGSVDTTFTGTADSQVLALAVQSDGRILTGGSFLTLSGVLRRGAGRLLPDGGIDATFVPPADIGFASGFIPLTDGRTLAGGAFSPPATPSRPAVLFQANGEFDPDFNLGCDGSVFALAALEDGRVIVAGSFTTLSGQQRNSLGRLSGVRPALQQFSLDGSTLRWTRSGGSPDTSHVIFESSADGIAFMPLGTPARTPGGWELSNAVIPPNTGLRARALMTGGNGSGSTWFTRAYLFPGSPLRIGDAATSSGNVAFTVRGPAGWRAVIEASGNLQDWTSVQSGVLTNGALPFSELILPANGERYYRARVP